MRINNRQVTLEFATAKEAKLFKSWYRKNSTSFFMCLDRSGKWGKNKLVRKWMNGPIGVNGLYDSNFRHS